MSNLPSTSSRPIAAAKSRKNLLKQPSSIGGTSLTQPVDRTPLPAAPSNAQLSFTFGTSSAEGSSLPTAPGALSDEDNARFSFTSDTGTLPADESSLPSASVAFGNKRKAKFDSGVMPEIGSSLLAEPLVFGMQSDDLSFTSGTVPAEGSPLPAAPSVSGTQSYARPALDFSTQSEKESIEKLVADLEAEMARSEGFSAHTQLSDDINYGLDMTFGLDTNFFPAVPNIGQNSKATDYPDPSGLESGISLPYFAQDLNIQDLDLPYSSFIPGLDITQDPFTQDPYAQDPFSQDPDFPLDSSFVLTSEPSNHPSFAASTQPPDPSVSQNSDRNVQDNTRFLPSFIPDCSIRDPYLPSASFSQHSSFIPDLELAHDPFALNPFSLDPFSQDPFGLDPFAHDLSTQDISDQDPSAQDPSFDQELNFPLDPIFDLLNEPSNYPPIATSTQPPDPSVSQNSDRNVQDNTRFLPSFIPDCSIRDPYLPSASFSQHSSFIPDLELAHDPFALDPFGLDSFSQDPFGLDPFAQDPSTHNPSDQDPSAQDPSFDQELKFPLDPIFDLPNEPSNDPPIATSTQPPDPEATQYSDPNAQDNMHSLTYFTKDTSMTDVESSHSTFHQDVSFIPGLDITQDPIAQGPSFDQKRNFPLDPSFHLANEPNNYPTSAANAQPPDPSATQYSDPNAQDNTQSSTYFTKDTSMTDLESPHSTFHQDASFIPGLDITQDPIAQDPSFDQKRNFPLDPSFHLANEPNNYPTSAANAQPPDPSTTQYPDQKLQDMTRPLPYFIQDSSMRDPAFLHSPFHQDARLIPGPYITQDPIAQDPVAQDFIAQDPVAQDPVAQDFVAQDPVTQDPVTQNPVTQDPVAQDHFAQDFVAQDLVAQDLVVQGVVAQELVAQDFVAQDHVAQDHVAQGPVAQGPIAQDFASQDPSAQDPSFVLLDPNLDLANERIPKANEEEKRSKVTSGTSLASEIFIPATTIGQVVTIDLREIQRLRAEIERKNKEISDKDDEIKRSTRKLQDQDTENKHLIKRFRGDLDKLRREKSTLEKANQSLAREKSETKENQGKAEKDTELIRKLNCELGRIRKKQSALVKTNESLAKDCSELRAESDKLCESNSILKEENRRLRSSLNDHSTFRSELVEAKETIRAQENEIRNSAQRIAALSACVDEISPKLLWQTEELQEAEECALHEESVSKYYRDRCSLLSDKCNALEAAGDSRDTEFAKIEMEEEQRHRKELEALNLQIRDLEVANKRLAQMAGNVGGSADIHEADKIRELPLPKSRLDENQEPPGTGGEPLKKSLRLRQEELKAQRKQKAKERFEPGKTSNLRAAHEARLEEVAALSIPVEDSGPQDGTPAAPHSSAPVVPKADETRGEEGTTAQTAPPTRSLSHNIWSMILWYKGVSHKWEWAFLALFITLALVVGIIGAYLSYLDAVITILDEAVDVVPLMVERGMPAVEVRRYMQRGLGAAGVPGL